jgi:bifunctional ADP-heptose synthase (sugar kinase/adenylyltransferase)
MHSRYESFDRSRLSLRPLAERVNELEAARFGNLAASVTIMKKGTGAATFEEVLAAAAKLET